MVPTTCARCHSSEGFVDYLGGDNTVPGVVDNPAPTESVVRCATCHTPAAETLTDGHLPLGRQGHGSGPRGHLHDLPPGPRLGRRRRQGDRHGVPDAHPATDDTASPMISFTNIHYYPAAATLFAGRAKGGYQYAGQVYDTRFRHVDGLQHLHRLPRSPLGQAQGRRLRHLPRRGQGPDRPAQHPHDVLVPPGLRRRRQPDRGHVPRAGRPAGQAAGGHRPLRRREERPAVLRRAQLSLLVQGHQRRRRLQRRGGDQRQRLQELDAAAGQGGLQLPDGQQGSRRLRPQRQVHHGAAVRLGHRRERRPGGEDRPGPGGARRPRPLRRRQRGRPPLGQRGRRRRHLLALPQRPERLPLLRPARRQHRGARDRQRPRVRHLPHQLRPDLGRAGS